MSSDTMDRGAEWVCGDCGDVKTADSIKKLNDYFVSAIMEARDDVMGLEDLLTKATKMFHPSHYVPTLAR